MNRCDQEILEEVRFLKSIYRACWRAKKNLEEIQQENYMGVSAQDLSHILAFLEQRIERLEDKQVKENNS